MDKEYKIKLDKNEEDHYQKIRPRRRELAAFDNNTFVELNRTQHWKVYIHEDRYLITLHETIAIIVTYDVLNKYFCDGSKSLFW